MTSAPAPCSRSLSILLLNQIWFLPELRARGHRVVAASASKGNFDVRLKRGGMDIREVLEQLPRGFHPDCIIYHDDSGLPSVTGLEDIDAFTIFYSVDAHHHHAWHALFGAVFDLVLVAHKDYISWFTKPCHEVRWFPLWAPLDLTPQPEKTIDVAFRGNLDPALHPKRARFFEALSAHFSVDARMGGYADVYTRARIVVNQAVKKDLNFRVFEGMMSGALLVTPMIGNGLCDLFTPGEDLATFEDGNVEDAIRVIKYYLEHEDERQRIAANGHRKMLECHTKAHRAREIEELVLARSPSPRPQKFLASALVYLRNSEAIEKASATHAKEYAVYAARNILASIERGEPHPGEFPCLALRVLFRMDDLLLSEQGDAFAAGLMAADPGEALYPAAHTASLVERGEMEAARRQAAQCSEHIEHYLNEIPEKMRELKHQLAKIPLSL